MAGQWESIAQVLSQVWRKLWEDRAKRLCRQMYDKIGQLKKAERKNELDLPQVRE